MHFLVKGMQVAGWKVEHETHSIAMKVIFILTWKVHVHVIEDLVLKRKLKDKLHA
jgi:hypothetical protein